MESELVEKFRYIDTSDFPDFYEYNNILERSLWVLWVAKEKIGINDLSAEEIELVIRDIKEISIGTRSIVNALSKGGEKVHVTHYNSSPSKYRIMKPGKDYLASKITSEQVEVLYFEPFKRFSSKRILSKNLLSKIEGDFGVVDPYVGVRTLDILKEIDDKKIKFLTKLEKLRPLQRSRFLRHLADFKTECNHIEFRDYPSNDIHDRYIVSDNCLVLLGHSIKDLGSKETFSIFLKEESLKDIVKDLRDNFNRRWNVSTPI